MKESSWSPVTGSPAGFARAIFGWQSQFRPAAFVVLMVCCQFAYGQSLDEINKREEAVRQAWVKTPLTVRRALFVSEEPAGFGIYTPRSSARFKAGEQMIVYAEPVGFTWRSVDDSQYEFGVKVDLIIKTAAGKTIGEQENFGNLVLRSRTQNQEFLIHLDVNVSGAPAGDYLLAFRLHDAESDKAATIELPFSLE
jgi:hypothetical protein